MALCPGLLEYKEFDPFKGAVFPVLDWRAGVGMPKTELAAGAMVMDNMALLCIGIHGLLDCV